MSNLFLRIVTDISRDLIDMFGTNLPKAWDMAHLLEMEPSVRSIVNTISYFCVYGMFNIWFVDYFLKKLKLLEQTRLWFLGTAVSLFASTQVLWPTFLMFFHFFFCGFYPWASSIAVILFCRPFEKLPSMKNIFQSMPLTSHYAEMYAAMGVPGPVHQGIMDANVALVTPAIRNVPNTDARAECETGSNSFYPRHSSGFELHRCPGQSQLIEEGKISGRDTFNSHLPLSGGTNSTPLAQSEITVNESILPQRSRSMESLNYSVEGILSDEGSAIVTDTRENDATATSTGKLVECGDGKHLLERKTDKSGQSRKKKGKPLQPGISSILVPSRTRSGLIYGPNQYFR